MGPVYENFHADRRRDLLPEDRQQFLDGIGDFNRVGARLSLNSKNNRSANGIRRFGPARGLIVFHTVNDIPQLFETNRRSAAVHHNKFSEIRGIRQLAVRAQRQRPVRSIHRPGRHVHVPVAQCSFNLVHTNLLGCQFLRIEVHAHRVLLRSLHLNLRDSRNGRNPLCDCGFCVFVQCPRRHGIRFQREEKDGLVGWIHFTESRRRRHAGGQQTCSLRNSSLDVKSGSIEVTAEIELKRDLSRANTIRRRHRIQPGDRRELPFQRCCYRRRHRVRVRSGQIRRDHDRGKIHGWKIADSQNPVRDCAE